VKFVWGLFFFKLAGEGGEGGGGEFGAVTMELGVGAGLLRFVVC
jgi:hypothetical protein